MLTCPSVNIDTTLQALQPAPIAIRSSRVPFTNHDIYCICTRAALRARHSLTTTHPNSPTTTPCNTIPGTMSGHTTAPSRHSLRTSPAGYVYATTVAILQFHATGLEGHGPSYLESAKAGEVSFQVPLRGGEKSSGWKVRPGARASVAKERVARVVMKVRRKVRVLMARVTVGIQVSLGWEES